MKLIDAPHVLFHTQTVWGLLVMIREQLIASDALLLCSHTRLTRPSGMRLVSHGPGRRTNLSATQHTGGIEVRSR
jgi:hypothetical protein